MQINKRSNSRQEERSVKPNRLRRFLALVICAVLFASGETLAEQFRVQLIYTNNNKTHLAYIAALKSELSRAVPEIKFIDSSVGKLVRNKQYIGADFYVGAGVNAADYLSAVSLDKPVIYALIPEGYAYRKDTQKYTGCERGCIYSVLDQPVRRRIKLLRHALPDIKQIGVLLTGHSETVIQRLQHEAKSTDLKIVPVRHTGQRSLMENLSSVLERSELLFASPDPEIYNRQTARSIILTAYAKKKPIFGYSAAYTRAGAVLSLHSSPQQYARHDTELITEYIKQGKIRNGIIYPRYFSVSTNQTVARSLRLHLESPEQLAAWLRKHDDISKGN